MATANRLKTTKFCAKIFGKDITKTKASTKINNLASKKNLSLFIFQCNQ
jgi:hypothetical protein